MLLVGIFSKALALLICCGRCQRCRYSAYRLFIPFWRLQPHPKSSRPYPSQPLHHRFKSQDVAHRHLRPIEAQHPAEQETSRHPDLAADPRDLAWRVRPAAKVGCQGSTGGCGFSFLIKRCFSSLDASVAFVNFSARSRLSRAINASASSCEVSGSAPRSVSSMARLGVFVKPFNPTFGAVLGTKNGLAQFLLNFKRCSPIRRGHRVIGWRPFSPTDIPTELVTVGPAVGDASHGSASMRRPSGRTALPASMTTPSFSLGISPAHSYTSTCNRSGLFPLR